MKTALQIFFLSFLGISLATAASIGETPQKKPTLSQEERLNDSWVLQEFDGKSVTPKQFPSGMPTLQFYVSKDKVNGFGGCNRFPVSYTHLTLPTKRIV